MKYFIANWKMELTKKDVVSWITAWEELNVEAFENKKFIVAPSFLHLGLLSKVEGIYVAAQNVSIYGAGAHTGQVSAAQVGDYCDYAILGHSELDEPLEITKQKINLSLECGLTPIVCFKNSEDVKFLYDSKCIMAWEDPQNISGGGAYNPKEPSEIAETLEKIKYGVDPEMKLVYGGSVNHKNVQDLMKIRLLDGVLVGKASLTAESFYQICGTEI